MSATPEPWALDSPTLLKNTLGHVTRAWVSSPSDTDIELNVIDGTLSFDEGRTPRVTADLSCAIPEAALLDIIDPRLAGRRVILEAGYRRPDGTEDVQQIANLMLRGRALSYPDNTMRITATSDEAKLLDDSPSNGGTVTATGAKNAIAAVFSAASIPATITDSTGNATAFSIDPLGDKWDAVEDITDQIGADFYGTGAAADDYVLTARPALASSAAHTVTTGNGGTITDGTYRLDRDDWFNRVFLEHTWRDSTDADKRVAAVGNATGVYAPSTGNVRTLHVVRNTPSTAAKAATAAQTLANRQATRGRSMSLTAISAYWLRPGDTIAALLPDIDPERHLLSSVTFRLGDGLMDLTTRLPE